MKQAIMLAVFAHEGYGLSLRALIALDRNEAALLVRRCEFVKQLQSEEQAARSVSYETAMAPEYIITSEQTPEALELDSARKEAFTSECAVVLDRAPDLDELRRAQNAGDVFLRTDMDEMCVERDGVFWRAVDHYADVDLKTATLPLRLLREIAGSDDAEAA